MHSNDSKLASVEAQIEKYLSITIEHRRAISNDGVWLFLTSLGCWGVPPPTIQLIAFIVALFMFAKRAGQNVGIGETFNQIEPKLHQRIEEDLKLPSNKDRLKDRLAEVKNRHFSIKAILRGGSTFLMGWFFFGFSMLYTFWNFKWHCLFKQCAI